MKGRLIAYVAGGTLIAIGLLGILADSDPVGWALWFGGAVIVHDVLLAPLVLLAGALTTRLPRPYRRTSQAALMVAGGVTLVALPLVLGLGRRADNPSQLPLPYGRNLVIVLALVGAAAVVPVLWHRFAGHRGHDRHTCSRVTRMRCRRG